MTDGKAKARPSSAIAAVGDCADTMEAQAANLRQALPTVSMPESLRAVVMELLAGLQDTSGRVTFELALLQSAIAESKADTVLVVQRLSRLDAAMMVAVVAMTEVVDRLEGSAEENEAHERAFVLVIEAVGVMLQQIERAKAATQALGTVTT